MITEAIDKIEELVKEQDTTFVTESGLQYVKSPGTLMMDPQRDPVALYSLSGLVDFLKEVSEQEKWFCRVTSPTQVSVLHKAIDKWNRRSQLSLVDVSDRTPSFQYGKLYSQENFIIQLHQCFHSESALDEIIKLVSSITITDESGIEDNGISQIVHVKGGVALKDKATIENPIKLTPYLTFPEIIAVKQEFVLRVYKVRGTELALHASESKRWELDVMENVKNYLKEKLPKMLIV